jgi:hypothetical protein
VSLKTPGSLLHRYHRRSFRGGRMAASKSEITRLSASLLPPAGGMLLALAAQGTCLWQRHHLLAEPT